MKKAIIFLAIVAVATFSMAFKIKPKKDLKYKLEHLTGTYADAKPYNYGKAWGNRVFTFNKGKWTRVQIKISRFNF